MELLYIFIYLLACVEEYCFNYFIIWHIVLQDLEKELHSKRQLLLQINQQLESTNLDQTDEEEAGAAVEAGKRPPVNPTTDLIEDMMLLNEEVEDIERQFQTARNLLKQLG